MHKDETDRDREWEEILDDIEMQYLPVEYLKNVIVTFNDGTVWDINIEDSRKKQTIEQIEESIDNLFVEYDEKIDTVDFRLDIEKVKKDLSKKVSRFLKNK